MWKYLILFFAIGLMMGCKKQKKEEEVAAREPGSFSLQSFPEINEIGPEALAILSSWPEYMAMENSFAVLKRATNTEDLKLAIDDLVEKEKALADGDYPPDFDKPQIKSRQQVFRTFLFKVKANLMDNRDVNEAMEQMINAYNAYKQQFNIISSTTLDATLILDEK